MLSIQLGLLKIPVMTINLINSRYAVSGLHQFSPCCNERVGHQKVCKKCGKEVLTADIQKGMDKDTILTNEQGEELKELLENGIMEVIGIREMKEKDLFDLIPYIQKSMMVFPSISKGYKKTDVRTFFSFVSALKELKKICMVKLVQRAVEHLGVLVIYKEDLLFLEIPFRSYYNLPEVLRIKEAVNNVIELDKIEDLEEFKEQAVEFIKTFKSKKTQLSDIEEEKAELLKQFINEIREGKIKTIKPKKRKKEVNPFVVK